MNIVKHFNNNVDTPVPSVAASVALPGGFVIPPGNYTFGGATYNCAVEGYYKFCTPRVATRNKIVYQNDVAALVSGLAWSCCYGFEEAALSLADRTGYAIQQKLRMQCGDTCIWAKYVLDSGSIECRIVRCLTAGTPNNESDGHVMLEVKVAGAWVLFDIANKVTFGANLPLKDALPLAAETALNLIADDKYSQSPPPAPPGFDVHGFMELVMRTPEQKRAEMQRLHQIPGIMTDDGLTHFYLPAGMESRASYVTGLDGTYRIKSQAEWLATFYP